MLLHTPIDMTLQEKEALCTPSSSDVLIYDTFNAAACAASSWAGGLLVGDSAAPAAATPAQEGEISRVQQKGRRKRRRRERSVKNREDAEVQRMTHIAVERNRRRQMNEYLAALRSLMPESYVHRGDQASIVSGAIDCVKELELQLQSLEAKKRALRMAHQQQQRNDNSMAGERDVDKAPKPITNSRSDASENGEEEEVAAPRPQQPSSPPFSRFFRYPQYVWRQQQALARDDVVSVEAEAESRCASGVADVEASVVVDAHASVRVLAPRRPGQLLKMVAGMQALKLSVLHLSVVTAADALVLYTISLKVEEGCALTTADEIAAAVHHALCIIEAEAMAQQRAFSPPDLSYYS